MHAKDLSEDCELFMTLVLSHNTSGVYATFYVNDPELLAYLLVEIGQSLERLSVR